MGINPQLENALLSLVTSVTCVTFVHISLPSCTPNLSIRSS